MNSLILGDLHITNKKPGRRKDKDYLEMCLGKLEQAFTLGKEHDCEVAFQPGDWFDSPQVGNHVIIRTIKLLKKFDIKIFCTYGQHDILGHSTFTLKNSPLSVLQAAGVVRIVPSTGMKVMKGVWVYGSGFGSEVPMPRREDHLNILLTHRMIGSDKLFDAQKDFEYPVPFLKKHPEYDWVIVGDYHYPFQDVRMRNGGRCNEIINVGCMVRKTLADVEHQPMVGILHNFRQVDAYKLECVWASEIFDLTQKETVDSERWKNLIDGLQEKRSVISSGIKSMLLRMYKHNKTKPEVRQLIEESLQEVG